MSKKSSPTLKTSKKLKKSRKSTTLNKSLTTSLPTKSTSKMMSRSSVSLQSVKRSTSSSSTTSSTKSGSDSEASTVSRTRKSLLRKPKKFSAQSSKKSKSLKPLRLALLQNSLLAKVLRPRKSLTISIRSSHHSVRTWSRTSKSKRLIASRNCSLSAKRKVRIIVWSSLKTRILRNLN